ncbi:Undecaprenol kinase [Anatilimnocola aggregata]|uniref:Undecaprenol kinase n=1 Tax=Anatilimnocola aggregata TaxID=2528021 RepID=A0A517YE80_9BACT|nr:diacylglycerol kinase family protein [Anatilimnocola aggregata]QDU28553.1 Undecaprenol kinase [Anatilimnocola aggregata]
MNFSKFLRSFTIGFLGLSHIIRSEQNMRLHCCAAIGVIIAGFVFSLAAWEWVVILFCLGLVISAECLNKAVERLADRVTREQDPLIKQAKDCGSAAVLVVAITAAAVGGVIFLPKIWALAGR